MVSWIKTEEKLRDFFGFVHLDFFGFGSLKWNCLVFFVGFWFDFVGQKKQFKKSDQDCKNRFSKRYDFKLGHKIPTFFSP